MLARIGSETTFRKVTGLWWWNSRSFLKSCEKPSATRDLPCLALISSEIVETLRDHRPCEGLRKSTYSARTHTIIETLVEEFTVLSLQLWYFQRKRDGLLWSALKRDRQEGRGICVGISSLCMSAGKCGMLCFGTSPASVHIAHQVIWRRLLLSYTTCLWQPPSSTSSPPNLAKAATVVERLVYAVPALSSSALVKPAQNIHEL